MIHTMLPAQFGNRAGVRVTEPHKRLMAAVLQAVVDDCREDAACLRLADPEAGTKGRGARKAIAYVASSDRLWPFSFENLCEALGLDAECLREELDVDRDSA